MTAALTAGTLSACSPDPTHIKVVTDAATDINPSDDSPANPVVVRVYSLQNKDAFSSTDFTPLYTTDRKVLAADIISRDEFEIRPGEKHTVEVKDAKNAGFVGVLAAFRDIDTSKWRDTADAKPNTDNNYTVHIGLGSITIKRRKGFWSFLDVF